MSINPVSNVSALFGVQQAQNQSSPKPKSTSTHEPTDTVQLSPQALAHIGGHDGDGDGH